jgi:F-type H+-transporting ATPase subunit gamma
MVYGSYFFSTNYQLPTTNNPCRRQRLMAQTQGIKRRIRSVRNAGQITKALEVVAAARMRKIQELVGRSRTYGELADSIMRRIAPSQEARQSLFFKGNDSKEKLYIVFNSDRGQAGAFNSNIFNLAAQTITEDKRSGFNPNIVAFGRKGTSHFARISDIKLVGAYESVEDAPPANFFAPVLETVLQGYLEGRYGAVDILFTEFRSSLNQQALRFPLLPVSLADAQTEPDQKVYEFEPDLETVIAEAMHVYIEAKLLQSRIESAASENAMRMVAMGNAHRNASDLIENLTLELNSLRQAAITQEIAEITGGSEAMTV